ncbi:hypothetical protein BDR05DRAFT_1006669 [Suillus weaverae]|nr:hypothetical protein BDR05DRAFT_1006669 [Suillus weaverae]
MVDVDMVMGGSSDECSVALWKHLTSNETLQLASSVNELLNANVPKRLPRMPGLEPLSAPSLVKAPAPSLTLLLALFLQCLLHHIPFLVKAPAPPAFWKHLTSNETLQLTLLLHHPIPPDGTADFSALIRPPASSDPQLPLWSPPDTSAQRAPPSTLHPPPSQHPPHFSGTGGSPIDDPDGDLDDDPHADNNNPFFAPLGNALSMMELDPSRRHVISLDSPPRSVGQKRPYTASPSPPPMEKNTYLLPWKPQMLTYHSREVFGSAPFPSPRDTCSLAQLWDGSWCSFIVWRLTD